MEDPHLYMGFYGSKMDFKKNHRYVVWDAHPVRFVPRSTSQPGSSQDGTLKKKKQYLKPPTTTIQFYILFMDGWMYGCMHACMYYVLCIMYYVVCSM